MEIHSNKETRSFGELFSELTDEMRLLVRQEVELARVEMTQKVSRTIKNAALLAVGGAVLYAGLLALIATAIIGLAYVLPWWLSALVVGVVTCAIGYFLVAKGRSNLRRESLKPEQTMETLKEDKEWAKGQMT